MQLTQAIQFHGPGSRYSLTSLSYQENDETISVLSPPGKRVPCFRKRGHVDLHSQVQEGAGRGEGEEVMVLGEGRAFSGVECVTPELWDKKEVERRTNGILVGAAGVHGWESPLMSQEWHLLCSGSDSALRSSHMNPNFVQVTSGMGPSLLRTGDKKRGFNLQFIFWPSFWPPGFGKRFKNMRIALPLPTYSPWGPACPQDSVCPLLSGIPKLRSEVTRLSAVERAARAWFELDGED